VAPGLAAPYSGLVVVTSVSFALGASVVCSCVASGTGQMTGTVFVVFVLPVDDMIRVQTR
jgi:hypothetical protein